MSVGAYKKQKLRGGWTRVDLLLQIYDRAITSIEACAIASQTSDSVALGRHTIDAHKAILAIHAGLKPEEDEVAFNIERLIHFCLASLEQQDYESALKVLNRLREGFAAVADEANRLEQEGVIPAIPEDDTYLF